MLDSTLSLHAVGLDKRLKTLLHRHHLDDQYSVSVFHDSEHNFLTHLMTCMPEFVTASRSSSSYDVYLDYKQAESRVEGRRLDIAKGTIPSSTW